MEFKCNSFWPHHIEHSTHLVVVISTTAVLAIILNPLLIYSLCKTKQIHTNTFRFMIAMSISDSLQAAIVMPSTAVSISIREYYKSCFLDQATQFGFYLFGYFSFFMLMGITFERLYQLKRLRKSPKSFTKKQLVIFLVSCVAFSVVYSYCGVAFISFKYQMGILAANVCLLTPLYVSYGCVLHKVRIHDIVVAKNLETSNNNNPGYISARVNINITKIIWVLLISLTIFYAPFNITTPWLTYVLYEKKEKPSSALTTATIWAYMLIFLHSSMNAFVCLVSNRKARRFLWEKINKSSENTDVDSHIQRAVRINVA